MAAKKPPFFLKINGTSRSSVFDTTNLFGTNIENGKSPIDIYIKKNKSYLIKLGELERANLIDINQEDDRDIYNLFLLGFVSNVESYFRRLIRQSILIDKKSLDCCLEHQLTYAAALHHNEKLLPEALLEHCSFISYENIKTTANAFLGIGINKQSSDQLELIECLKSFEQLCHLRHCIVHRAGLLGSKNAVKLGLDKHKAFFEKPIALNAEFLQEASTICLNCVRTFNNFAFSSLLSRYVEENKSEISWNYNIDRKWFSKYFNLFNSEDLNQEAKNANLVYYNSKRAYDVLRGYYK